MGIRKAIRQIQDLTPGAYAIKALLLTDARVVPLDQVFSLVAHVDEAEIAKALMAQPNVTLEVTKTEAEAPHG